MSKSTKWIVAALALSLAINVFVIGFAIGKRVVGPRVNQTEGGPRPGDISSGGLNVRALGQYLSEQEKRAARRLLAENRDFLRENGRKLRQNEQQIRELLMAEEVDIETLSARIAEHEVLMRDTHLTMRRVILEFVATLDADTRRAVAADLFRRSPRHGPGGQKRRLRNRPPPPDAF